MPGIDKAPATQPSHLGVSLVPDAFPYVSFLGLHSPLFLYSLPS